MILDSLKNIQSDDDNGDNSSRDVARLIFVKWMVWVLYGGNDPDISARPKIIFYYTPENLLFFFTSPKPMPTGHDGSTINKDIYASISSFAVVRLQNPGFQKALNVIIRFYYT